MQSVPLAIPPAAGPSVSPRIDAALRSGPEEHEPEQAKDQHREPG